MFKIKIEEFKSNIPEMDYYMNFIPFVDGKCVTDVIQEHIHEEILIDPYLDEDLANEIVFENGRIGIEIPKDYFDNNCKYRDEYISEYSKMLQRAYNLAIKREKV